MLFTETNRTYDIERVNGTDSAKGEFTIIPEDILMQNISVFDIERDGSVGNISVDVDINLSVDVESTVIDITISGLSPGKIIRYTM